MCGQKGIVVVFVRVCEEDLPSYICMLRRSHQRSSEDVRVTVVQRVGQLLFSDLVIGAQLESGLSNSPLPAPAAVPRKERLDKTRTSRQILLPFLLHIN